MASAILLLSYFFWLAEVGNCNDNCQYGALRLVNGSASYQGRLEICIDSVWGSICGGAFDALDARVACRQLGYEVEYEQTVSVLYDAYYHEGTGPIWLSYLYCTGSENSLLDCNMTQGIGNTSCSHANDVSIVCPANSSCTSGSVRLTDGLIPTEGTVEVCNDGAWTSVCDSNWGYQEAFVVCRQLGLPATDAQVVSYINSFGYGHGLPILYSWNCYGNESNLNDCLKSTVSNCFNTNYGLYRISGVRCQGNIVPTSGSCTNGDMRLVDPNGPNLIEGRVEYCSNEVWSTICRYGFNTPDAHVVCRKLGYQHPRALVFSTAYFGPGSGPITHIYLNCIGNESRLEDCSLNSANVAFSQSHTNDVGVKCLERVLTDCINGDVRLVNGTTPDEGRVEVCINGEWGTVCSTYFDEREIGIVCSQLGYDGQEGLIFQYSEFGGGNLEQLIGHVYCTGSEANLTECTIYPGFSCSYRSTVGIKCYNRNCTHGKIRLIGGDSNNEGDFQICYDGVWVYVCNYINFLYNYPPPDENVICRQLGYLDNNWNSYFLYSFGEDGPIVLDKFLCNGNELSLTQCSNKSASGNCYTLQTYGYLCSIVVNCSAGMTTLGGDNEGRVEICTDGIWTTIDARYWNYNNAKVVCRQLGYYDTWSVAITDTNWSGKNERVGYTYECNGTESNLENCSKSLPSINADSWYYVIRGGIECQHNASENACNTEGSIRLSNGGDSREGRVEICLNGYWGTVCSTGWDERDALVACTQAGHHTLRAIPVTNGYFGRGTGPVHMTGVDCTGNEESLTRCSYVNGIGATNCYHAKDVGVMCKESPIRYSVTIDTDTDAVSIGSRVVLTCNVSPAPPVNSTYHWRRTVSGTSSFTQYRDTDPNVTLTINAGHTTHGNYYCIVKYNGAVIGMGHTVISVKGLLQSSDTSIQLNSENGFVGTLTVNITDTTITEYLLELNWYYNGSKISNSSKHLINNGNKTLVINNITDEDIGEYSVRFDLLRLYHYNKDCQNKILQLLRGYPVLSPLSFIMVPNGIYVNEDSTPNFLKGFVVFNNESPQIALTSDNNEGSVSLYHNGILLLSNGTYNYTIIHPSITDSGYYEFQFALDSSSVLSSLNCPSSYQSFLDSSSYLGLTDIFLDADVQRLEYYESPFVSFNASQTSFMQEYNVQLSCSVSGGYPRPLYHDITLIKNGVAIANSTESELVYNTSGSSKYGLYQCAVDTTAQYIKKEILLEEK
ncbi:PREDICTED: scavenger receptor cysteine-rich domain superfamily protein-like isoform X2 [Amphimedon queenslandica]|nr:PREDICTED: scavenger receptor cysteine-rich domain superfamily protein-like isoform X2 [Amphimedon queenslandica]|eukprot:XP_019851371.1 PREDICTED: scavenger receptor cysteine-rich domain superfamily protein-like isoform X2 [Amphimedon queenslandica]